MTTWKKITKKNRPPEGEAVWFYEPAVDDRTERVWIGAYEYSYDAEGWFFGNLGGHFHWSPQLRQICFDPSDNEWDADYKPTHWMPLPFEPAKR
jgi:hypothetical protein